MAVERCSADQAVADIADGATIALTGSGTLLETDALTEALERRFLATGHPRDLTLVHALGIGDGRGSGLSRFAHPGMVRRVIGGHWTWSRPMQELARRGEIAAWVLPGGVIQTLLRESGAGRPGLITPIGLHTFADPRNGGGRVNDACDEELVELLELDGREYLRYRPIAIDVALVRGTALDANACLSAYDEPVDMEIYAAAIAARNNGGRVLAQVREIANEPTLPARLVSLPAVLLDRVVVSPDQRQLAGFTCYDPSVAGRALNPEALGELGAPVPQGVRRLVAERAADELRAGACVNFGFGLPSAVPVVARERGCDTGWVTLEQGLHNGDMFDGPLFGAGRNPQAILRSTDQFDFYSGGGVDIAFLGMGELDAEGNVNVSWLGEHVIGPGGFVDISQGAKKVVFCGTFEAKGLAVDCEAGGRRRITRYGDVAKVVDRVRHVSFSGRRARADGQQVLYVTERAVFSLQPAGLTLIEVPAGIDLQRDLLARMPFRPQIAL